MKTALKILEEGRFRELYDKHEEKLDLFQRVIKLPYHDDLDVPFSCSEGFNERKVMRFLAGYGIEYTGRMKQSFSILN